ncbi:MAG: hypothetical protein JJU30_11650, partial [Alkalimonas sp.]|nr:hypothetical protein [Alkalimonas sp.]
YSIPRCYHPEGLRYVAEDPSRYSKERGYDAVLSPALLTEERYQQIFAMMLDYWQNLTVYFAPFDDLQNLAALEKQVISDLLPVENISATASPYATYCIDYQGDLPAAKVAALRRAASQQLLLDPTRPSKARYYLKQAVS